MNADQLGLNLEGEVYGPEQLNPRGQVCREIRMAIKRGRSLAALCSGVLDVAGTPEKAMSIGPWGWGVASSTKVEAALYQHVARRQYWQRVWPFLFQHWYSGALERCERIALEWLPQSLQHQLR